MKQIVILLILDGWGIGRKDFTNPIYTSKPQNINRIRTAYLSGSLQSSGIAVGLPWEEEGNSEVGHLNIGSGKVIYQHFPKISINIQSGEFFKNKAFLDVIQHAKKNNSALHLAGLATEGNVHASLEHLKALIDLAKREEIKELYIQIFSDGKDSNPKSLLTTIGKINQFCKNYGVGKIASISGRYYALDRDEHWARTEKAYTAMTEGSPFVKNFEDKINEQYKRGLTDEFIEPMAIGEEPHPIKDNDALIFFDFREDSIRQIASSFILNQFDKFPVKKFKNLRVATMTDYSNKFNALVAFPNEAIENPLGKVLSDNNLLQLRIAETEKYAHVTYFFNGYKDEPFQNEFRVLIPSKNIARHDEMPEMMIKEISARIIEAIYEGSFDFILANFANSDMIAHTGNYDAALQAIKFIDEEIGKLEKICLEKDAILIITSDHGNIERMIDPFTGRPETKHDPNLVPFYLIGKRFQRQKSEEEMYFRENEAVGILADIAPTILDILEIEKPEEMTGDSLLKKIS